VLHKYASLSERHIGPNSSNRNKSATYNPSQGLEPRPELTLYTRSMQTMHRTLPLAHNLQGSPTFPKLHLPPRRELGGFTHQSEGSTGISSGAAATSHGCIGPRYAKFLIVRRYRYLRLVEMTVFGAPRQWAPRVFIAATPNSLPNSSYCMYSPA
jgi:hypothetical protein